MSLTKEAPQRSDLDAYLRAFEAALAEGGEADLSRYLPDPSNPIYATALKRLVALDLEHSWRQGRPKAVAEYQQRYPELFRDPAQPDKLAYVVVTNGDSLEPLLVKLSST